MTGPKILSAAALKEKFEPKRLMVEVTFNESEMEYIKLRYQKDKGLKEIADDMGISVRMVKLHAANVLHKLNMGAHRGDSYPSATRLTKVLLKYGFINIEEDV